MIDSAVSEVENVLFQIGCNIDGKKDTILNRKTILKRAQLNTFSKCAFSGVPNSDCCSPSLISTLPPPSFLKHHVRPGGL